MKSFLRHFFQRRRPVEFWKEQWAVSRHTWDQLSCSSAWPRKPNSCVAFVKPSPPNTSIICSPARWFVSRRACGCFVNNTSARCASVSSLFRCARETVVVGRQKTAFVVSCDTAERFPLTSFLHFLQSPATAHPIDAGSTVARLVHGHNR